MPGNMAELLMNTGEGLGSQVNHAKEVLVQVSGPKNDKLVEREVELLQRRRDKEAERFEISCRVREQEGRRRDPARGSAAPAATGARLSGLVPGVLGAPRRPLATCLASSSRFKSSD